MKVLPFNIPKPANSALIYQVDQELRFYDQLHQHEEIQISVILQGTGDLVVGDTISRYQPNDVLVIGSNVPHLFRSDEQRLEASHMLSLFFTENSFGNDFFELNELNELRPFFEKSKRGMRVLDADFAILHQFEQLERASQLERFVLLLKIVHQITKNESTPLASFVYQKSYSEDEGTRMSRVMNHAMEHFQRDLSLDEIAALAAMSPNAFCRYFKQRTNKTFFQFLNEIRVAHACRLIVQNEDLSMTEVSEMAGFRNMSNFNRKFKQLRGCTPSVFRLNGLTLSEL